MVSKFILCLIITLILNSSAQKWKEPLAPASLTASSNATGVLRVGAVVELTCTSHGMPSYVTVHWKRDQGGFQFYLSPRGYSPLKHVVVVSPELHGAEYFCSGPHLEQDPSDQTLVMYTIRSNRIRLAVEGGTDAIVPDKRGRIEMTSFPNTTTHRVGDLVSYYCITEDLDTTVVDVIIAKGNTEIQLHTGWQPTRLLRLRLTAAEDGAALYCVVGTLEEDGRTLYGLESNRLPIHVQKK